LKLEVRSGLKNPISISQMTKSMTHCSFSIVFYFTRTASMRKDSNQDNIGYSVMGVQPNSRDHGQCTLLHATLDLRMDVL
jgi:hypothetical protein